MEGIRIVDIPGYENLYCISERGEVWNKRTSVQLFGNVNSHGYMVISLTKDGKKKDCKLHRLLALAFIPNPNNYERVNHKDGNKLNNRLDNLEWCTKKYNNHHAREELQADFSAKPVCQTTMEGSVVAIWANHSLAAKCVGVSAVCIAKCCEGLAKSAGGYRWEPASQLFRDYLIDRKKETLRNKIAELTAELETL